jgi:hypothetical protein
MGTSGGRILSTPTEHRIGVSGRSRNGQDRSLRMRIKLRVHTDHGMRRQICTRRHSRTGAIARHGRRPGTRTVIVRRASVANFGGWDSKGKGGFVKSPSLWRAFLPTLSARAERIGPRRDGQAGEYCQGNPGGSPPRQGKTIPTKKAAERSRPFPTERRIGGTEMSGGRMISAPTERRIGGSGMARNGLDRSLRERGTAASSPGRGRLYGGGSSHSGRDIMRAISRRAKSDTSSSRRGFRFQHSQRSAARTAARQSVIRLFPAVQLRAS